MAERTQKRAGSATALFFIRGILIFTLNLILYAIVLLGTVEVCKGTYAFANEVFGDVMAQAPPGTDLEFEIRKADDPFAIAKNLEKAGLVSNAYSFYIRLKFSLSDTNVVVAGNYKLNTSMTYKEILEEICRGVSE